MDKKWKDLEITRKCTKIYELIFKKNGTPEDITGWTVYFIVKENMNDTDDNAKISKVVTSHSDPTSGKTLISLDSSDTDIDSGVYYYTMDFKDDENHEDVLFRGRLKIVEPLLKTRS